MNLHGVKIRLASVMLASALAAGFGFAGGDPDVQTKSAAPSENDPGMSYFYFLRARDCMEGSDFDSAEKLLKKARDLDPGSDTLVVEHAMALLGQGKKAEAEKELADRLKAEPKAVAVRKVYAGMLLAKMDDSSGSSANMQELWQKAVEEYNTVLQANPKDKEALFFLGRLYYAAQLLDRAEDYLRRYLEVDSSSLDGALFLAQLLAGRDKLQEALEILKQAEVLYPEVVQIRLMKAKIQEQQKKVDDAEGTYKDLIARNPHDPGAYVSYARILQEKNKHEEAVQVLEAAIRSHVRNAQILGLLGISLQKLNQHQKAIGAFRDAVEDDPKNPENLYYLAVAYSVAGDSATAVETLAPLLAKLDSDPSLFDLPNLPVFKRAVLGALVQLNLDAGRDGAALTLLERLIKEFPEGADEETYIRLAGVHKKAGDSEKALAALDEGEKLFPGKVALFATRQEILSSLGRWEEVQKAYAERLKGVEGKERATVCLGLALAAAEAKKWDEAIAAVARGLEDDPGRKTLQFQQGAMLERAGRRSEADAVLSAFLRENPDNALALNYLGYMLIDYGMDVDRGMAMVRKALELEPFNPAYLDSLGWGYFRKKDYPKAMEYIEKSLKGIEGDPTVLEHAGDVAGAMQDAHKARACYEKSIELQKDPAEKERIRKKQDALKPALKK